MLHAHAKRILTCAVVFNECVCSVVECYLLSRVACARVQLASNKPRECFSTCGTVRMHMLTCIASYSALVLLINTK